MDHPYLGIHMVTLSPDLREEINRDKELNLNITADKGVLVIRVIPDSPAQRAGFKSGDIIKKVATQSVATAADVQEKVEKSEIGSVLEVEIDRNGETKILAVKPGAFPSGSNR
ncbi:MAG: PDZ domain-containing protein [Hydrococcus sp. Prado102]|nr:PDZ domain-containing protein [Hydrococcus sp. Prado102]